MNVIQIILVASWIPCSVLAYLLFRSDWKREINEWKVKDRRGTLFLSFIFGPFAAMAAAINWGINWFDKWNRKHGDQPAKW